MKREDRRRIKDTKVVRGAEISSDHYLVLLVTKRCWREVRQKGPVEQNTLKWNAKKLGERNVEMSLKEAHAEIYGKKVLPWELSRNGMGRTERGDDRGG